jgi:phosphoribosyl 1,2-cyclic phosphate phosphodiesterase
MKITVLGCGASGGVPLVGCECATCTSINPKNRRMRASILMELPKGARVLVDTGPDLREQCLTFDIRTVDAIFYTHAHADHCHGIDDVRSLNYYKNDTIPAYSDEVTLQDLQSRFGYVFKPKPKDHPWYRPSIKPISINDVCNDDGIGHLRFPTGDEITFFEQRHGKLCTWGIRAGNFAYSIDVNFIPRVSMNVLNGVTTWLVDCLRYNEAPSHAHLNMTLEWIDKVKPQQAYLTHMGHDLEYDKLCLELPDHIRPAYDGLVIEL